MWACLLALCVLAAPAANGLYTQPRFRVMRGNLFIESPRNISIASLGGGYVHIQGQEVSSIVRMLRNVGPRLEQVSRNLYPTRDNIMYVHGPRGLMSRIDALEARMGAANVTVTNGGVPRNVTNRINSIFRRVTNLERRVREMDRLLTTNECASNPCRHGGTCEDAYGAFICRCPPGWEGQVCDTDVDECSRFGGYDGVTCQNGGTCINTPGSYRCQCSGDWLGLHCTQATHSCTGRSDAEMCGNGLCVPGSGPRGISCICNPGWKNDPTSGQCTVDVDECTASKPPCSHDPAVPCINVPGSFYCGACPNGYVGNGYYCTDVNECLTNNGGCSTSPSVQCINTRGSRMCGPCPPGFQGDGMTCTFAGSCEVNNGGCHPLAQCYSVQGSGGAVVCLCRQGYTGTGMGPAGCVATTTILPVAQGACASSPCINGGSCAVSASSRGFQCRCPRGFKGVRCEFVDPENIPSPCDSSPCLNGGTCSRDGSGFVCDCPEKYTGDRCEKKQEACGGFLRSPSGTLRFPPSNSTQRYSHELNCGWVITTNRTKVLNVTFSYFHIEQSPHCNFDWLQIHDGASSGTHQIGRFCGHKAPRGGNIISTHNALYLWFRSDPSVADDGFELHWTSIAPVCGGEINLDSHASISSPGSPGKYPANRDCYWRIEAPPGQRVQLHFFSMQIEQHPNCSYDFLEVRDGFEMSSPLLARFCNTTHPPPLVTSTNEVVLHFHSDAVGQDAGFQITASVIEGTPGCGGVVTEPRGEITPPGQSAGGYRSNLDCGWRIQIPMGERIALEFLSFDLEHATSCAFDYVEIRDGRDDDAPLIGRYCGTDKPPAFTSSGNVVYVRFHSDMSFEAEGFTLSYEAICGGVYTELTGILTSPYYPNPYPRSRRCTYEIRLPTGNAVALTFLDFDVEYAGSGERCYFDYVQVRDGDNENATSLGTFCGPKAEVPDHPILSTHNYMYIEFVTDSSVSNHGFKANYSSIEISCGGIFKERHGVVESPRTSDGRYPHDKRCSWVLVAPPGFVVQLTWVSFSLEKSRDCQYDHVAVYDNSTEPGAGGLLGRYCGKTIPPTLISMDSVMNIVFQTDRSVHLEGFMATYTFIDQKLACGGRYYSPQGVLRSPGFPEPYPSQRDCEYIVQVPFGRQISINFTEFDMESAPKCNWDYLEIRNGGSATSPLIGKYCGKTKPPSIVSISNELYFKFKSDSSNAGKGFQMFWDAAVTGCGGAVSSPSGSITSPNYPQAYGHSAECFWSLTSAQGSVIKVVFLDMDLEAHNKCNFDYVELWDGLPGMGSRIGRYCTSLADPVSSNTNHLYIKFHSDMMFGGRGFHIHYETVCNTTMKGFRGVIESPSFPDRSPHPANCSWVIAAPTGNKINITFSHMDIATAGFTPHRTSWRRWPNYRWAPRTNTYQDLQMLASNLSRDPCHINYIEFREGDGVDEPSPPFARFCGTKIPDMLSSSQDHVYVTYQNMGSNDVGFRLEWVVEGCGGELRRPQGSFTSPGYPNMYPDKIVCEWTIIADLGSSVQLTVEDFSMEHVVNCSFDSLKVFGGRDENSPKLTELCHTQKAPLTVPSSNRYMFVRFESDFSYSGHGFKASYKVQPQTCGGRLTAPSGSIHSPNYPQNYNEHDNCIWTIEVDKNHVIRFSLTDLDLVSSFNCSQDNVMVFDGQDLDAPVLMQVCGNAMPEGNNSVVSTGNTLTVRMRSTSRQTAKGFLASYTISCGARIITDGSGIIQSVDSINVQGLNPNCSWIIMAEDPGKHVTLTMTHLVVSQSSDGDVEDEDSCSSNYVEVREGVDMDGAMVGRYCGNKIPLPITSQGSALHVNLVSPHNEFHGWFAASYSVLTSACGGTITAERGSFASPAYPDSYPVGVQCVWNISASAGNRVQLNFRSFNLEDSPNCVDDYLEIRKESANGPLLGVYCGDSVPSNLTATHSLWIKFRSNGVGTAPGFVTDFALVHGNLELTGPRGEIASPMYPMPYAQDGDYRWRIMVSVGKVINIRFKDFAMDRFSDDCYQVYVQIYDGFDDTTPSIFMNCGSLQPDPVTSSSNVVYVRLFTNPIRRGTKFLLEWLEVEKDTAASTETSRNITEGCGTVLSIPAGGSHSFHSPGYPYGYGDQNCTWTFDTKPGWHFLIHFEDMDIEQEPSCSLDSVKIYSGDSTGTWHKRFDVCLPNITYNSSLTTSNLMMVNFWADYSINGTGFKATVYSLCGGDLQGPNGVVETQEEKLKLPLRLRPEIFCEWTVTVAQGRTIEVIVEEMNITREAGEACGNSYLMLKNGGSADSPLLGTGKYCGDGSVPEVPHTSSNKLFIKYRPHHTGSSFKLVYRQKSVNCGEDIVLSEGSPYAIISSPNYPNIPPAHSECVWRVRAPTTARIALDFVGRFDLSQSANCQVAAVELRDGGTENAEEIGRFCQEIPGTQSSKGNMMYVRFFTDAKEPKDGFSANVSIAACGGTIRGVTGVISSPQYPHGYPTNTRCEWRIIVPVTRSVKITFLDMSLFGYSGVRCNDSVEVLHKPLSGTGESDSITEEVSLGTFCGSRLPPNITGLSNEVTVRFKSYTPRLVNYRGFMLRFVADIQECGGKLETESGSIRSPGYPRTVPRQRCAWYIKVPTGRRVTATVRDLDLSINTYSTSYLSQRIFFYHDEEEYALLKTLNFTTPAGAVIESTSNTLTVVLYSFSTTNNRGFVIDYVSNKPAVCGGTLPETMVSPLLPPANLTSYLCVWRFVGENEVDNRTLVVSVDRAEFTRAFRYPCAKYHSRIFLDADADRKQIGVVCNTLHQPVIWRSPYPNPTLTMMHSSYHSALNVSASYRWSDCGGVLHNPESLSSPRYPIPYTGPVSLDCAWSVNFEEGKTLVVQLDDVDLSNKGNCRSYLRIYNGNSARAPLLAQICDKTDHFSILGHQLWIEYHVESSPTGKGFRMSFLPSIRGCGGTLHGSTGMIESPGLPLLGYPKNTECEWDIRVDSGFRVVAQFEALFNLELTENCTADFVELFDHVNDEDGPEWVSLGRYCGRNMPPSVESSGSRMRVLFRSDDKTEGEGFKMRWSTKCGFNITVAGEGYIVSPGFPEGYSPGLNCSYNILAPDKVIELQFLNFSVEAAKLCQFDNVTVYLQSLDETGTKSYYTGGQDKAVFCDHRPPRPLRAKDKVHITFQTDRWVQGQGFKLLYRVNTCNEVITKPTHISSPGKGTYLSHTNCTWNVTAPPGMSARIRLTQFRAEHSYDCYSDHLEVYDGPVVNDDLLMGRFCGDLSRNLPSLHAKDRYMVVRWVTDSSTVYEGFRAVIWFTPKNDGKLVELAAGGSKELSVRHLRDFEDQQWVFTTVPGNVVQLTINSINIEPCFNNPKKCCNAVVVRDGTSQYSELIRRMCGTTPYIVTSSDKSMWVQVATDGIVNGSTSVSATARSVPSLCGELLLAFGNRSSLTLQSPGFPSPAPANTRCHWVLELGGERVRVDFKALELEGPETCIDHEDAGHLGPTGRLTLQKEMYTHSSRKTYVAGENPDATVYDYNRVGLKSISYCGNKLPAPFYINDYSSQLHIVYSSGQQPARKGFQIQVRKLDCSGEYREPSGRFTYMSHMSTTCDITIVASAPNQTVSLFFESFMTSPSDDCRGAGVEVRDGADAAANQPVLVRACGMTEPPPVFSTRPGLSIKLWTSPTDHYNSAELFYITTDQGPGCGGYIHQYNGMFTSPLYPGNFRNASVCRWDVETEGSAYPALWFSVFDLGPKSTCDTDFIELFDVDEQNMETKRSRYCGQDKPAIYRASTRRVAVKYTTSVHNGGVGWVIKFTALGSGESVPKYILPEYLQSKS